MNIYAVSGAILTALTLFAGPAPQVEACGGYGAMEMFELAPQMISADEFRASAAIEGMRALGAPALQYALAVHRGAMQVDTPVHALSPSAKRARSAIDKLAGQKDAHAARLFWHTDMDAARRQAETTGKPILSLRLLGRLDEDLSCANSRFFRTALYANQTIADTLRRRFVLHWKSVRPVPVIKVDFGDGRTICRTITGNSIHYVLMPDGGVIDALPGLYAPQAFLGHLHATSGLCDELMGLDAAPRETALRAWHKAAATAVTARWNADVAKLNGAPTRAARILLDSKSRVRPPVKTEALVTTAPPPSAKRAARLTASKGIAESSLIRHVSLRHGDLHNVALSSDALRHVTNESMWAQLGTLHRDSARLDATSKALLQAKAGATVDAGAMRRVLNNFESSLAQDSVRNEYDFHLTLHAWFADGDVGAVDSLNERVYADLFLTPSSDPWLGLVPRDTFTGLDLGGLESSAQEG